VFGAPCDALKSGISRKREEGPGARLVCASASAQKHHVNDLR
jgi:hypothetical protein